MYNDRIARFTLTMPTRYANRAVIGALELQCTHLAEQVTDPGQHKVLIHNLGRLDIVPHLLQSHLSGKIKQLLWRCLPADTQLSSQLVSLFISNYRAEIGQQGFGRRLYSCTGMHCTIDILSSFSS